MCTSAAIGIYNDLPAGKACIPMGTTNDEFPGGIYMVGDLAFKQPLYLGLTLKRHPIFLRRGYVQNFHKPVRFMERNLSIELNVEIRSPVLPIDSEYQLKH